MYKCYFNVTNNNNSSSKITIRMYNTFSTYIIIYLVATSSFVFSKDISSEIVDNNNNNNNINNSNRNENEKSENNNSIRNYVATTPKVDISTEALNRYEQGLEDYDEAVARVEKMKEDQQAAENPLNNIGKMISLFSTFNNAWKTLTGNNQNKQTNDAREVNGPSESGFSKLSNILSLVSKFSGVINNKPEARSLHSESSPLGKIGGIIDLFSAFDQAMKISKRSARSAPESETSENGENLNNQSGDLVGETSNDSTAVAVSDGVEEGRYIKGDPLKGYYDFIITEGSYKFWAVFQLFTAGLMIYSTFAAIYYSKVNPIVSDYDYYSYLGGRSMADDPVPIKTSNGEQSSDDTRSMLTSDWLKTAQHSLQFVLEAIDKIPAQS